MIYQFRRKTPSDSLNLWELFTLEGEKEEHRSQLLGYK